MKLIYVTMMKKFYFIYVLIITIFHQFSGGVYGVSISDMRVPGYVRNGTGSAVLDCLYSLKPEEQSANSGLVVKWFFNNSLNPVYQWIHNERPRSLGILKNRLWLEYKASENSGTMHRALYIMNPTTELSGDYKCIVSTNVDEDFMIKKMVVYAPEKRLDLYHTRHDLETVNVSCRAVGAYPEPRLFLYNETTRLDDAEVITTRWSDSYEVTISTLISDSELTSRTTFECKLVIPNTPYSTSKILYYYPGSTESLSSVSSAGLRDLWRSIWRLFTFTFLTYFASSILLND